MSEIIRTASQRFLRTLERGAAGIVILLFIFAFLGVYFAPRIFVTIHSGEVGVMYYRFFGGTQTDLVLGEGVKLVMPWDRLYVYNVRVQEVRHSLDVLSNEGLTIKLHLSIRYHPEKQMVGMLQKTVGQNYKNLIVVPEVESAMRTIMGQFQMRQVYGSERGLIQKVINDSLEQASRKFVQIDAVVLRSVELPPKVSDAVQEKMKEKETLESYEYKLEVAEKESKRQQLEAEGLSLYNRILAKSLTPQVLKWEAIQATKKLAESPNSKIIVMGNTSTTMPLLLNGDK